jgi:hypothetical protein
MQPRLSDSEVGALGRVGLSSLDVVYNRLVHAVHCRNVSLPSGSDKDGTGIFSGEFAVRMNRTRQRPSCSGSMPRSVLSVLNRVSPGEIGESVVGLVSIKMATLHAIWAWTHKGLENEAMDIMGPTSYARYEVATRVSGLCERDRLCPPPRPSSNASPRPDVSFAGHVSEIVD